MGHEYRHTYSAHVPRSSLLDISKSIINDPHGFRLQNSSHHIMIQARNAYSFEFTKKQHWDSYKTAAKRQKEKVRFFFKSTLQEKLASSERDGKPLS